MSNRLSLGTTRYFLVLLAALAVLLACNLSQDATPTAEPVVEPVATTAVAEATPTATVPPVQTPTIVLPPTPTTGPAADATPLLPVPDAEKPVFARFNEPPVDVVPAVFHEPIAPDLSNVTMPFVLSEAQLAMLANNGFVVSPGVEKEFFTVYEQSRYDNVPIFITSDSLLHTYHLLFDKVLRTAEREYFIPLLVDLNAAMLAETDAQFQALQGTPWEDAARRTVAFVGVAAQLLDSGVAIPTYAQELVAAELANIDAASGVLPSAIFPDLPAGEDYTQYIPRGHYTRSEELKAYFRAMMWYGRMTFRLKTREPEVGRAETRSALLLVQALRAVQVRDGTGLDAWLDLYNPTVFFVGRSDDLTAMQYIPVIDTVYGANAGLTTIADDSLLDTFIELANELPPPEILGMVIYDTDDVEETTKGLRFMGQRFVPDAYIFRQLIYRNVGTREDRRGLPMGLDIMAAMGSERAYNILDDLGETGYVNYNEQMAEVQGWVSGLTVEEWTETLYNTWMYTFQPLLEVPGDGYPQFMQSQAWLDKQLNTSLGSWAELKHDTILYAKQVYAELGGGGDGPPLPKQALGYVEPVPAFYARLYALTNMTYEGLSDRGLLDSQDRNSLERLMFIVSDLQLMAEKELRGEPLTGEEYNFIRFYGGELEHLTMAAADAEGEDGGQPTLDEEPQAAVIADVATDPDPEGDGTANPVVLEEAVGRINEIYVVAPMVAEDGSFYLQVAKGGTFAYYEFPWPADDRLTDEKWREMLDNGEAPPLPSWTASFLTEETEYAGFQRRIYNFQQQTSDVYWYLSSGFLYSVSDEVLAQFDAAVADLVANRQHIGHQWLGASYRSFDRQSDNIVVITVRETWQDTLYDTHLDGPRYDDPAVGQRGPYTLDVTYTLELLDGNWDVTRVVYANEPPDWQ